jgi:predicted AAA+ superfamily ATPase
LQAAKPPGAAKGKTRELPVITLDQEDTLIEQGQSVRIIPGWKWLD